MWFQAAWNTAEGSVPLGFFAAGMPFQFQAPVFVSPGMPDQLQAEKNPAAPNPALVFYIEKKEKSV